MWKLNSVEPRALLKAWRASTRAWKQVSWLQVQVIIQLDRRRSTQQKTAIRPTCQWLAYEVVRFQS